MKSLRVILPEVCLSAVVILWMAPLSVAGNKIQLPENPSAGLETFVKNGCTRCHSVRENAASLGPDLRVVLRNDSFFDIFGDLWSHSPDMIRYMEKKHIARPETDAKSLKKILDFLYYINFFVGKGSAERGKNFFLGSPCISCHSVGRYGSGKKVSLDSYGNYASPIFLVTALWNHGPYMKRRIEKLRINWPLLTSELLFDISEFIKDYSAGTHFNQWFLTPGNPVRGRKLFAQKGCISCHSVEQMHKYSKHSIGEIASQMWKKGPFMWSAMMSKKSEYIKLSTDEMVDIISFIYFSRYPDGNGSLKEGRKVFEKNCLVCHGAKGPGPSVAEIQGRFSSYLDLMTAMWNHVDDMIKVAREKAIEWPRFRKGEMSSLLRYLTGK